MLKYRMTNTQTKTLSQFWKQLAYEIQKSKKLFFGNFSKVRRVFIIITYFFRKLLDHYYNFAIIIVQNHFSDICKKTLSIFQWVLFCCALLWPRVKTHYIKSIRNFWGCRLKLLRLPICIRPYQYCFPNILWRSKDQIHHN